MSVIKKQNHHPNPIGLRIIVHPLLKNNVIEECCCRRIFTIQYMEKAGHDNSKPVYTHTIILFFVLKNSDGVGGGSRGS